MKLQSGQGFLMKQHTRDYVGLIINITDEDVEYVDVERIVNVFGERHLSYDDPNAADCDKDNVYLCDCPPPFTDLSFIGENDTRINNAYAIADMSNIKRMSKFSFDSLAEVIDNGARISDRDMQTVLNHSCPRQPQKEKDIRDKIPNEQVHKDRYIPDFGSEGSSDSDYSL